MYPPHTHTRLMGLRISGYQLNLNFNLWKHCVWWHHSFSWLAFKIHYICINILLLLQNIVWYFSVLLNKPSSSKVIKITSFQNSLLSNSKEDRFNLVYCVYIYYVKFTYYFVCSFITVLGVEPRHCAYWGGSRPLGYILTTTHIEF